MWGRVCQREGDREIGRERRAEKARDTRGRATGVTEREIEFRYSRQIQFIYRSGALERVCVRGRAGEREKERER